MYLSPRNRGIERFRYTTSERAFRSTVTALLVALHAAAFCALWQPQPALAAAVVVSYVRNSLSLAKWALLLALAASGQVIMHGTTIL